MLSKRKQSPVMGPKRPRGRPPGRKPTAAPESPWQDRLVLSPGDQLCKTLGEKKGNLDQHEREHYDIIDAQGQVVGTVEYSASTLLRPPHRTSYWLVQKDIEGNVIVDKRW